MNSLEGKTTSEIESYIWNLDRKANFHKRAAEKALKRKEEAEKCLLKMKVKLANSSIAIANRKLNEYFDEEIAMEDGIVIAQINPCSNIVINGEYSMIEIEKIFKIMEEME